MALHLPPHPWPLAATAACLLVGLSSCGGPDSPAAAPVTVTVTGTPSPSTTGSSSAAPATSPALSGALSSSAPGPLPSGAAGRKLTLSDFFSPTSNWTEDRYDVADAKQVAGIATPVQSCGAYAPQKIELRLANNFDTFSFSVGQANNSPDFDQNLSVQIMGNNAQLDIQSVPFNQVRGFEVPVTGVNALEIRVSLDDKIENCGGSVIAVITDPVVA
jgi:hypothetical protein